MFHKRLVFILIIIVIILGYLILGNNGYNRNFYDYVNRHEIDSIKLGKDEYTWSRFKDAQDNSDDKVSDIVKNIIRGNDKRLDSDIVNKIRIVWDNANDMDKRNSLGIGILGKYIDRVNNSNNMNELLDSIILIENDLGVDILTNINIGADYKDNTKYIVYFYPVTYFGNSSSDYYVNDDYMTYKAYLKRGIVEILQVYGYDKDKSRSIMHDVIKFYEDIGNKSKLNHDLENITTYYNIINNKDISNIYNNIDIKYYLERRGIIKYNNYSIVDRGQYEEINKSFTKDNIDIWKNIILLKVLSSYGEYLSHDYIKVIDNINNGIMGVKDEKTLDDKNIDIIKGLFSQDIDFIYSDILKSSDKKKILDMSNDIRDYYLVMLDKNEWLSKDTIDKAKSKLDSINIHIGLEEYDKISNKYNIRNTNLIDNVIEILRVNRLEQYSLLDGGKDSVDMNQVSVNAYYTPLKNSIYIPSSIKYLYDEDDSYYKMLGSIGMIIAHEITHAIDTNGAQFDSKGNINNWWSDKDLENFNKYRDKVIEYYNGYEVSRGKYINGKMTVNENIADLGAVACISGIALDNKASKKEIRDMYEAFAKMWASKDSPQYTELLLLQDVHSPNKYRVNAVLSSTDLYYKTYSVNMFDKMYKSKKNRVHVW